MVNTGYRHQKPQPRRDELDEAVDRFLAERTVPDPSSQLTATQLRAAWVAWCLRNGRATGAPHWFGRQMSLRGVTSGGHHGKDAKSTWPRLRLRTADDPAGSPPEATDGADAHRYAQTGSSCQEDGTERADDAIR